MPQKTNLNVAPYYDDYDVDKNFYRVLFRPGYSVQTRELTSLQTILQNQIENYGRFFFKQGQQVIPGGVSLNTRLDYVKLSSVSEVAVSENGRIVYKKYDIKNLVNSNLRGINSGVIAKVVEAEYGSELEADTLFVKYISSGDSSNEDTFRQGETLEVVDGVNTPLLVVGTDGSVLPTSIIVTDPISGNTSTLSSPAMGFSTAAEVEEGIYFVNGFFVKNSKQLLIIDKYYDKASARVGFSISEEIITPESDVSLYDNAKGYSNASAPGAHRLSLDLILSSFEYQAKTDKNFIQLLQIKNGVVEKQVRQADYTLLEETLARRTYDESGDYVVEDFDFSLREFYQRQGNNGVYQLSNESGLVNGYSAVEAESKMVMSVSSGKAYVKGFEIVNKEPKSIEVEKGRDTLSRDNVTLKSRGLPEFSVTNIYGTVPLNTVGGTITGYPTITLNSVFNDGTTGFAGVDPSDGKSSVSRRSEQFTLADGIKTVFLRPEGDIPTKLTDIPDELYFVTERGSATVLAGSAKVIGKALVPRVGFSADANEVFMEVTLLANKANLEKYITEYDDSAEETTQRYFYQTEADTKAGTNKFGSVVDYNETITPIIGLAKPKDYRLKNRAEGFNQDTDIVISKGPDGYNSTFGFTYFNPKFFTKLTLDREIPTGAFLNGKYVYGKTSKAYGVIEDDTTGSYSCGNKLFVTTLFGEFVDGETIIDEENNTIKIAKENTISHFIVNSQGAGYQSPKITINDVEFDLSKIDININGNKIFKVIITDSRVRNTAYNTKVTVGTTEDSQELVEAALITPVLFKNTVLNYTPQNVKSFGSTYNNYKFTADIDVRSTSYAYYTQITDFTFFGYKGTKVLECNGFGADLFGQLIQGDVIQFNDANNQVVRSVVQRVDNSFGTERSKIYLDYALQSDVSNASVIRVRPRIENSTASLVFPTGSKQVASVVSDSSDTKFKYHIRKDFVTELSTSGIGMTFTAQLPIGTQKFVYYNENDYIITVLDKGGSPSVENGDIIYIDPKYIEVEESSNLGNKVSAGSFRIKNLPSNYFGNITTTFPTLKLTATVEIDRARPRLKTVVRDKKLIIVSSGDRVIPLRGQDYDSDVIEIFSYADAFKLKYVYEGTVTNPPTIDYAGGLVSGTDITYKYDFDNGQRDHYYDVSRIVLKPGFDPPTGQLIVIFDYFEHSTGDFSTVDSYVHQSGVPSEEIPVFNSETNGIVALRDCIDFRPKVDGTTTITGFQDQSIASQFDSSDYISFVGNGGVASATPASSTVVPFTMSFSEKQYLDRIDGLFLTKKGEFVLKKGNSSLNPSKPETVDDSIALAYLHIPAYTNSSKDVRLVPVDNRRFTMKDIGKLEKRIERLEYYTTLSILEQQALNTQIKDEYGLDRNKSGFIVDNFESHGIGNLSSVDYKCAIDTQQSVLRPQTKEDSFRLQEINTRDDQRTASGYVINDNVVSLPYTEVELLGNKNATKTINPNPFVVIQYVGDSVIYPQQDTWYDQSVAPLVSDSNTKLNSIFLAKEDSLSEAYSSIYNSFIVNWTGVDKAFFNIDSFADINSEEILSTVKSANVSSSSNVSPQNNEVGKGLATKNVGEKKVTSALTFFARSIPIEFTVNRLKPNTKIYVYMDGRDITRWVAPDGKFTGIAGNSLGTFGADIITDSNGNVSGIILVPAGLPPVFNSVWTGNVDTVNYDAGAEELRFNTGTKTIRFTSSAEDSDKGTVDTYAEVNFYASGSKPVNPPSITSTATAFFKANEGIQTADSNTDNPIKPNPLAQTFKVENYDLGVMTTGVDLFFKKKSKTLPLRAYLTDVALGKPGKFIIPGTQVSLNPETYLRVYVTGESETISITKGEIATGLNSNAAGPIVKVFDGNNVRVGDDTSTSFNLNKEQVYTLVLDNHNGTSFIANEPLSIPSIVQYNATNNTTLGVFIAKDSGRVTDLIVQSPGGGYDSATITIESPQLPGGSVSTASIFVSDGKVYNAEVALSGNGYTEPPAVVIKGVGSGSTGAVIVSSITIDTPAVSMGISVDYEGQVESTTPTRFNFKHPVYLQNNKEYALVVETDSLEYEVWASKLGEIEISTSDEVTTQPLLGSVYKSQNTDSWSEDIFEDLKFTLYRAEFTTGTEAELELTNEKLGYELLEENPFETSVRSPSNATSRLFKNNNYIVKVNHRDHGFEDTGKSYVFFANADTVGGIPSSVMNGRLFTVANSGLDSYNIFSPSVAGSTTIGGGDAVIASYNRKYERLFPQINYLELEGTKIDTTVFTTNVVPVDSTTQNYSSYDTTDYERTFLNEEHFFINQKMVTSSINSTLNEFPHSLKYKLVLTSNNSAISPLVDLRTASVKTATNRVENASGKEDRYGKRNQVLSFLKIFRLDLSTGGPLTTRAKITTGSVLVGRTSKAEGTITSYENDVAEIRLKTNTEFAEAEFIDVYDVEGNILTDTSSADAITVQISSSTERTFSFANDVYVTAYYPGDTDVDYENRIEGKAILWDAEDRTLIVENSFNPIEGNYTAKLADGLPFSRFSTTAEQPEDIFRTGDIIKTTAGDERFLEIDSVTYTDGVDFVPDTDASNSSSVAKYVTKEVSINTPGTSVVVKSLINTTDNENVKLFYKFKTSSSSVNFDDTQWIPFNIDGNPDVDILATPANSISGQFEKQDDYQELTYSVSDLPEFTSFAVKIVLRSDNPAYVPKIQDLRAIASY